LPEVAIELLDAFEKEERAHQKTITSLPDVLYQKSAELDQIKAGNHPDWSLRSNEDLRDINFLEQPPEEAQQQIKDLKYQLAEQAAFREETDKELQESQSESVRLVNELTEAQQTIARQREALEEQRNEFVTSNTELLGKLLQANQVIEQQQNKLEEADFILRFTGKRAGYGE
jgi:predicted  nucleic acid-binding Zn-ribbon protein